MDPIQTEENNSEKYSEKSLSIESKKNICTTCDKEFSSGISLRTHVYRVHKEGVQECDICKKHVKALKEHMKIVHSEDRESYKCDPCNKELTTKQVLEKHFQIVHHKILKNKCDLCTKAFSTRKSLISHIKKYHEKVKDFKCKQCDKEYFTQNALNCHVKDTQKKQTLLYHIIKVS